jgi:DNA-directed RNA polymerase beta subunit
MVGLVTPKTNSAGQVVGFVDSSILPKRGQRGTVDSVYKYTTAEGLQGVKIRVVEVRDPVLGDKFGSRHGQKGTVGIRISEEDMPVNKGWIETRFNHQSPCLTIPYDNWTVYRRDVKQGGCCIRNYC